MCWQNVPAALLFAASIYCLSKTSWTGQFLPIKPDLLVQTILGENYVQIKLYHNTTDTTLFYSDSKKPIVTHELF